MTGHETDPDRGAIDARKKRNPAQAPGYARMPRTFRKIQCVALNWSRFTMSPSMTSDHGVPAATIFQYRSGM